MSKLMSVVICVIVVVLGILVHGVVSAVPVPPMQAGANIDIVSVKGKLTADGKWVETVVLKNNGATDANGVVVTSWPYNDKGYADPTNPKGPRKNAASQAEPGAQFSQMKTVDIPAGAQRTVTFTYEGADAKKWKSWYVDVYVGRVRLQDRVEGELGNYAFVQINPGTGGMFADVLQQPFPAALVAADLLGPESFSLALVELSLPPAWSLEALSPSAYTLSAAAGNEVQDITAIFATAPVVGFDDIGFVRFDIALQGTDHRWGGRLGIEVVPEPSTLLLLGTGLVGLGGGAWKWHRRRARRAVPSAPGAAGVRVWEVMSRGRGPRGG